MRVLLFVFSFLVLSACTSGGSGDSSGRASDNGRTCSDIAAVCVGDPVVYALHTERQLTVTEIVARGELSSAEKKAVADAPAEGRAEIEGRYREMSGQIGGRIFAKAPNRQDPEYFSRSDWHLVYRLNGCAPAGHPCAGDKNFVFEAMIGSYYQLQEVLGFAIVTESEQDSPYLVRLTSPDGKSQVHNFQNLGTPLYETGCTTIRNSKHPFCVGEKYLGEQQFTVIAVSKPDVKYPTVIVLSDKGKYLSWYDVIDSGVGSVQLSNGCLAGAPDLCLPSALNFKFLKVDFETWMNGSQHVKLVTALTLMGIYETNLANFSGGLFRNDKGTTESHTGEEIKPFYRGQGCTPDGKICAGKVYLAPTWANYDFTVTGFNMSSKTVVGTYRFPGGTEDVTGVYNMTDIGAAKAP